MQQQGKQFQLLGEIISLMMASKIHQHFPVRDINHFILPPLKVNQFRIYRNQKQMPVGFVSWAKVTNETRHKFLHEQYTLDPTEWQTGSCILMVDFLAPFGHAKKIIHDLRYNIFPHDVGHSLHFDELGKCSKIVMLRGSHWKK